VRAVPPNAPNSHHWAILSYVAVCIFWGTSSPAIRFTTWFIAPLWIVVIRFALAGGLLWFALALAGKRPPLAGVLRVLPSGVALSVSNVLVTLGFHRVESGSGTLLLATTAVTFAVVDILWPGGSTKPSSRVWFGLLLGLSGVAVLVFGKGHNPNSHWSGYIMLAASAWAWALASVAQARRPSGLDPLQSSAWQMLIAATCVLPIALLLREPFPTNVDPRGIYGLAFLIVTASLIGFVGFVHMIRHMPPYIAGTYTYVNALVAALTGWLWLGEHLDTRFFIAAALVLSSVALIQLRDRRKPVSRRYRDDAPNSAKATSP
jgi:drug/metabolite transporter (DMT)-like permease